MSPPKVNAADAIPDDEIICADETGRPIFIEMLRGRHPVCFVAFDLLWLNGEDLRPLPLVERKARLRRLANHIIAEAMAVEARARRSRPRVVLKRIEAIATCVRQTIARPGRPPWQTGHFRWKKSEPLTPYR